MAFSGALTFHLLIGHFSDIGLTARVFNSHIYQITIRILMVGNRIFNHYVISWLHVAVSGGNAP
jgi:hypothetical protein